MQANKLLYLLAAAAFLSSCSCFYKTEENQVVFKSRTIYANEAETIGLQNLDNRVTVYCHSNFFKSAAAAPNILKPAVTRVSATSLTKPPILTF